MDSAQFLLQADSLISYLELERCGHNINEGLVIVPLIASVEAS